MTYEPLHHKYRPQTFAELVGQEAIAATLTNAICQQKIAPAYLFTGARGTGKTSSARILAKSLNCLQTGVPTAQPCGVCEVCRAIARGAALDIIEIDAASNTGVDNIRELIERAQFAPVQCRYKVYIIDEVHMLSTAAFNALLKTLEEPPDRVIFILATTDPQRVLPTIISRCQRFDYRRIPLNAMVQHLRYIADQEAIAIADTALTLIGQIAQGGLRDAESLLDQLSLLPGTIEVDQIWDLVGSVPERDLLDLLHAIAQDHPEAILDSTRRLMDRGREPLIVLQNLASFYRDLLIAKTAPARHDLVALTPPTWQQLCELSQTLDLGTILLGQQHLRSAEVQLKNTTQPRLWLEVTLMGLLPSAIGVSRKEQRAETGEQARQRHSQPSGVSPQPSASSPLPLPVPPLPISTASASAQSPPVQSPPVQSPPVQSTVASRAAQPIAPPSSPATHATADLEQVWQQVLAHVDLQGTRAMLSVNCYLLSLDAHSVSVGVKTPNMINMIKRMLPQLEGACAKAFKTKPKISLEVAERSPEVAGGTDAPPQSTDYQPPAYPDRAASRSAVPSAQSGSKSPSVSESGKSRGTRSSTPSAEVYSNSDQPPTTLENSWQTEDEVTRAAKNLAEFFAGKVVDDSDELPPASGAIAEVLIEPDLDVNEPEAEDMVPDTQSWKPGSATSLDEDDDDVPF